MWPEIFPDNCPPEGSEFASGMVYRLINGQIPKENDFKSYRQLYPDRIFNISECQVCGLSVYTVKEDVDRLKRRIPSARKKLVACGVITPEWGQLKHTPGEEYSHHSWWLPVGVCPWQYFQVV